MPSWWRTVSALPLDRWRTISALSLYRWRHRRCITTRHAVIALEPSRSTGGNTVSALPLDRWRYRWRLPAPQLAPPSVPSRSTDGALLVFYHFTGGTTVGALSRVRRRHRRCFHARQGRHRRCLNARQVAPPSVHYRVTVGATVGGFSLGRWRNSRRTYSIIRQDLIIQNWSDLTCRRDEL